MQQGFIKAHDIALNNYDFHTIGLIKIARTRPSIPEYSQIAENIRQAIDQVYNGTRDPKHALDGAATISARARMVIIGEKYPAVLFFFHILNRVNNWNHGFKL